MTAKDEIILITLLDKLAKELNENAVKKGFWDSENILLKSVDNPSLKARIIQLHDAEKIALEHSELSERLERLRKDPDAMDEHCPEFKNIEIEPADLIIRTLDWCARRNLRIGAAIFAKHNFNMTRPHKHGKAF